MPGGFLSLNEEPPKPAAPEAVAEPSADEWAISADLRASQVLERESDQGCVFRKRRPRRSKSRGSGATRRTASPSGRSGACLRLFRKTRSRSKSPRFWKTDLASITKRCRRPLEERFQKKGKEVSGEIAKRVRTFRVVVKDVLRLVYDWLKTIPWSNSFWNRRRKSRRIAFCSTPTNKRTLLKIPLRHDPVLPFSI